MKYLKIATTLLVLVAVVANFTFAGAVRTTGKLQLPQRDLNQDRNVKANKSFPTQVRGMVQEPFVAVPYNVEKDKNRRAVLSKTGIQIPKEILSGGLSGTFHIGTANQFKTIADMAFLMNIANISGPVTFLLDDASYTETGVAIGGSPGASATNTITIRPNTGNTACVISLSNVHANGGGLVLSGASYVTVEGTALGSAAGSQNLSIHLTAAPLTAQGGDAPVRLTNCSNVTVSDCIITGNSPGVAMSVDGLTNGNASVSINATTGFYNEFVTVNHCDLSGGHFGVLEMGNFLLDADHYGDQDRFTTVSNNYIHDVTENGMKLYQVTGATVSGNTVKRVVLSGSAGAAWILNFPAIGSAPNTIGTSGDNYDLPLWYRTSGISVWGDGAVVENNVVDSIYSNRASGGTGSATVYGIRVCAFGANDPYNWGGGGSMAGVTSGNMVKNNIVTRVAAPNAVQANGIRFSSMGIALEVGRWDTCVYNTVYMSGTGTGVAAGTAALYITGVCPTNLVSGGFHGYLSPWFSNGAYLTTAFSYRTVITDNIFAVDRTACGSDNVVYAIGSALGVFDIRTPSNNNVIYMGSTGVVQSQISGASAVSLYNWQVNQAGGGFATDTHSQADNPTLTSASDVHINPAGLSTADDNGVTYGGVTTDNAGVTRNATTPDIGALEGTGAGHPHDAKMNALTSPGAAGVPQGLPVAGFDVNALNLGGFAETGVPVTVHVVAPSSASQDFNGTFDAAAGGFASFTVNGPWTPSESGTYQLTIYCNLASDNYRFNDTIRASIPVNGQQVMPYTSGFENSTEKTGWFAEGEFGLGTTGGKLGGPHGGTSYYVTRPEAFSATAGVNGTNDKQVSSLYTPYFNLSSASTATLSFYQSINTEPSWDKAIVQYTVDTGKTWITLGSLNDADGTNWYSSSVYANAAGDATNCWDEATATTLGFPSDNPGVMPPACFTTNGDCAGDEVKKGPDGYILVALKLDNVTPAILGRQFIRFRYVYFTDAGTHGTGAAIDDFSLSATPVSGIDADYSGKVYEDKDANGSFDGADVGISGATVTLTYFGAPLHTTVTDVNGDYVFTGTGHNMNLPGTYNVTTSVTSAKKTSPADFNHTNATAATAENVGYYNGSISGKVYVDANNNGANDAEGGLAGFTVSVHKDSLTGASAGSAVTAADGNYSFSLLPGTYVVSTSKDTVHYRGTQIANYTLTVSGTSGGGTAVYTGKDFGFFKLATERVTATLDQNGNGTVDVTDIAVLPSGVFAAFTLSKGASVVHVDTIGSGTKEYTVAGLDTGNYTVTINVGAPAQTGYVITSSTSRNFSISSGTGTLDTSKFLWYKKASVSGIVYGDADGSGAKNGAEAGVAGWVVKIDGTPADTSDGTGAWSVAGGLAPGSHTVSLTSQAGYSYTQGSSNYTFTPNSGSSTTARDFGVFAQFSISGSAYRDRDDNGAKNGTDDALAGVVISLSKNGSAAGLDTTDASGNFSFAANGPGAYVVSAAAPSGYGQTAPESTFAIAGVSGTNSSSSVFGFFHLTDSVKYRTITAADIVAGGKVKPSANAKKDTVGNFANLLKDQLANTWVGVVGTDKKAGAYMQPKAYSDVQASTGADGKSAAHSGTPSGFDFTAKGKLLLGKQAALKSTTQDNVLFANLLALRINIAASEHGTTPAGFSSLVINDGSMFNGMTISAFANKMDTLMTFWKKVPQSTYTAANTLAANINSAFNAPFSFDQAAFRADSKIHMSGTVTVYSVAFLLPASKIVPKTSTPPVVAEAPIPTVYALYQNYPNPFNPTTNIRFDLPMSSIVTVKIYNMIGQEVATLLDHQMVDAGAQEMPFNASSLASGVYFYRVTAEGTNAQGLNTGDTFSKVMKMALIK